MKCSTTRDIRPLRAFMLAATAVATIFAHSFASAAGTAQFVTGNVSVINDKGQSRILDSKARVFSGETVVTGANGEVHLIMDDQGLLALRTNSSVVIDNYVAEGGTGDVASLSLVKGFARSVTGWIGKIAPQNYRIRAGNATVGIRGTDHEIGMVENSEGAGTYSKVNEGETFLRNPAGEVTVKPGRAAFVAMGRPGLPRLLERVPPIFKPSANENLIAERKEILAAEMEQKLKERQSGLRTTTNSGLDCREDSKAYAALKQFAESYETGNLVFIQSKLDPAMIGLQSMLDGFIDDFNRQKQIRLLFKDIQMQCGPDVAAIQFSWEKRFLDVNTFQPGLFRGRASVLMHLGGTGWRLAAVSGDNPFASKRGSLGSLSIVPGATFNLKMVQPAAAPLPLLLEVVDADIAGLSIIKVQVVTSTGDIETYDLQETSPGRFSRANVPVSSSKVAPGNGVLELANGVSLTVRYLDQNPGNNMPPTMLTRSFQVPGTLPPPTPSQPNDTTPDAFSFVPVTQAPLSSAVISLPATITGINVATAVSIQGGSYSINGAPFAAAPGSILNGQTISIRLATATTNATTTMATLTVGTISATFSATTLSLVPDTTPDAFSFAPQFNVPLATPINSGPVVIGGINTASPVSVSGGLLSVNGGPFSAMPGSISNGQTLVAQVMSSASQGVPLSALVTVGGVSASFTVTTLKTASDTTPDPFSFAPQVNVPLNTPIIAQSFIVSGIDAPSPISVTGGTYAVNGGAFTAAPGVVTAGQLVQLRVLSSPNFGTTSVASLTIGGVSATFAVTTLAADTTPDPFLFPPVTQAALAASVTSVPVLIAGINAATPVTILGGAYSINGAPFSATPGSIQNGQSISVRVLTAATNATTTTATVTIGNLSAQFNVTTLSLAPDTTPDPFAFTPQVNVPTSTLLTSSPIVISGINAPATVSVTGGTVSVNGGVFTANPGNVLSGQNLAAQLVSSAAQNTATAVSVTVGGVVGVFTVTTASVVVDTTPDPFGFSPQANVALNTPIASQSIVVSGINAPSPISVSGGMYSINGGAFTAAAGTVTNGQSVQLRVTSSALFGTTSVGSLNIGGISGNFAVTTLAADTTPDPFAFTPQFNVATSTLVTSTPVVISGINTATPVSVSGGTVSVNGGAFTAAPGNILNGQSLVARVLSSAASGASTSVVVNAGGVSATFTVTTTAAVFDTTPDPFSFSPQANVPINTAITALPFNVTGIDAPAPIGVGGGFYSINGGAFTNAAGLVTNGQSVQLRVISSALFGTTTIGTLNIGGVTGNFAVTTIFADTTPDPFAFTPQFNLPPSSIATSNIATITGINAATPISVVGGNYSISGAPFTAAAGTINNNQTVAVQLTSSAIADGTGSAIATLNVGGVTGNFNVSTWDQVPNAYTFPTVGTFTTGAPPCLNPASMYTTAAVSITGLSGTAPVSVVAAAPNPGALVSINGSAFSAGPATIVNGQTIAVRFSTVAVNTGSATPLTRATVTIGGVTSLVRQTCS